MKGDSQQEPKLVPPPSPRPRERMKKDSDDIPSLNSSPQIKDREGFVIPLKKQDKSKS